MLEETLVRAGSIGAADQEAIIQIQKQMKVAARNVYELCREQIRRHPTQEGVELTTADIQMHFEALDYLQTAFGGIDWAEVEPTNPCQELPSFMFRYEEFLKARLAELSLE